MKQFTLLDMNFLRIDDQIKELFKSNNEKYLLQYFQEYATYQLEKYNVQEQIEEPKFKRPVKRVFAKEGNKQLISLPYL